MFFFPYFVCALLGVDSVRGGLAEGNRIFWIRCINNTKQGVMRVDNDTPRQDNLHTQTALPIPKQPWEVWALAHG